MKQIPIKTYSKSELFKLLYELPERQVRAAMHEVQGENRKYKNILNPLEVESLLIELGFENLILKTKQNETNQQKSN